MKQPNTDPEYLLDFRDTLSRIEQTPLTGCMWAAYELMRAAYYRRSDETIARIPATEADRVWLSLTSPTFMGNTPGQWKRFLPLMDEHMNELPRRINAELRRTVRTGELSLLPCDYDELNAGRWPFQMPTAIPEAIENAPIRNTVQAAVDASRKEFHGKANLKQAWAARQRFEFMAMNAFYARAQGREGMCSPDDAVLADAECKRLFALGIRHVPKRLRPRLALKFLTYLIEPFRKKSGDDRKLARELLRQVAAPLRRSKLRGAVCYFEGCLLALEGEHHAALQSFAAARKLGREACGGRRWIDMLRAGLMTAEGVRSKREEKNFRKQIELFGALSNDSTPRTNAMQAQMIEVEYRRIWQSGFQPFPENPRQQKRTRRPKPKSAKPAPSK